MPAQQYNAIKYRFVSHEVGKLTKGTFGNAIISRTIVQNIMNNGHYPVSLHGTEEYNSSMTTIIQSIRYSDGIIREVQLARDIKYSGAVFNVMLTNEKQASCHSKSVNVEPSDETDAQKNLRIKEAVRLRHRLKKIAKSSESAIK